MRHNSHVYFEVSKVWSDYGKLSNKKLEDLIAGSRVEVSQTIKKNQKTLSYGNPLLRMTSPPGTLPGAKADQVGI